MLKEKALEEEAFWKGWVFRWKGHVKTEMMAVVVYVNGCLEVEASHGSCATGANSAGDEGWVKGKIGIQILS